MKQRYRQDCFNGGVRMKTKILTIAPYQGMKEIINDIASGRDDIEMTTRIGDLATGLEIVQSYDLDDFPWRYCEDDFCQCYYPGSRS